MICPDHGDHLAKGPGKIIDAYMEWSKQEAEKKALVVYDTMWHSTEKMAEAIAAVSPTRGWGQTHASAQWHRSDIMTEVLDAGASSWAPRP